MKYPIVRVSFALACLPILSGCSTIITEVGSPLAVTDAPMVEGETSMVAVLSQLGPPHAVSALPDGVAFLYEYSRVNEFQWGISLDLLRMPYFKLIRGDSRLSQSAQLLVFDQEGILTALDDGHWEEKLGSGGGLQFIISVLSLTDTTAFRRLPDPLLWGRASLQRPGITLNSAQELRSGRNGLQQRLAPVFAGQGALEMPRPKPLKASRQKTRR